MRVVPLCLDSDPSLVPLSCKTSTLLAKTAQLSPPAVDTDLPPNSLDDLDMEDKDPDDFSFWSERQAKRICMVIKQMFDVEYAPEVILADANLTALANRILLSREILTTSNTDK